MRDCILVSVYSDGETGCAESIAMTNPMRMLHMGYLQRIIDIIDAKQPMLIQLSKQIWELAEVRFEEYLSAELLSKVLENEGFQVKRGVADMETAFIASFGTEGPVIAILGEYDALPALSQRAGLTHKDPVEHQENGHGCGHNLLGVGSLAAAIAVRHYMEENNIPGTVRYYGCPAEEGGGGKAFMARAGLFDDADIALAWHPDDTPAVHSFNALAIIQVFFKFKGRSSHAGLTPHLGRSALDAVELMNVGSNYLREHIVQDARLHYAITNSGGLAPSVVQPEAEVLYMIRAPEMQQIENIYERVCNIARGAALMTETEVEIQFDAGFSNLIPNRTLEMVMYSNLKQIDLPEFDEQELQFAKEIRATFTADERKNYRYPEMVGKVLADSIPPYKPDVGLLHGSNDVGDVSWNVPTVNLRCATRAMGTPAHSWQAVSQGTTSFAHKGMIHAGKVLAATAIDVLMNPHTIKEAKAELEAELGGKVYECPIPPEIKPMSIKRS